MMIYNYLLASARSFGRYKLHFTLNVLGLGIGLAAAILIALYAAHEASYDKHQPNAERVYRVQQIVPSFGSMSVPVSSKDILARLTHLPGVEDKFVLAGYNPRNEEVLIDGNSFSFNGLSRASANIRDFIALNVIYGDLNKALTTPQMLALNRSTAIRLFGQANAIGNSLMLRGQTWTLAAVFEDLPENTHFVFNGLSKLYDFGENYSNANAYQYLRLSEGTDIQALEREMTLAYLDVAKPGAREHFTKNPNASIFMQISLEPLTGLHLNGGDRFEMKAGGSQSAIYICMGLSILLLVVAGFNFINMSIAQSVRRAKEVGVRKTMGASKGQIVCQFLCESLLIAILAGLVACVLVELTLPWFNQLMERSLQLSYLSLFGLGLCLVVIVTGLLAGLYPAFFMAAFNAKRVLSGDLQRGKSAIWVRKALLVGQSGLSVALIIGAIFLQQQLSYLQTLPVGYHHEGKIQVSAIPTKTILSEPDAPLVQRLANISGVNRAGVVDIDITTTFNSSMPFTSQNGVMQEQLTPFLGVDLRGFEVLEFELLAGRSFSKDYSADWYKGGPEGGSGAAIITESFAREAGYTPYSQALGQTFSVKRAKGQEVYTVVGVIKDITIGSVRNPSPATLLLAGRSNMSDANVVLDIDMALLPAIREEISKVLKQAIDVGISDIQVLSDRYDAVYRTDAKLVQLVTVFCLLAIVLACLGIFGLASFTTLRRQKEMAMRKVLGASRVGVVNLLAKEFMLLVAISVLLAFPLSYMLVGDWLANFNERITPSPWVYPLAASLVAMITWLTVAGIAFKVASSQPAKHLRLES